MNCTSLEWNVLAYNFSEKELVTTKYKELSKVNNKETTLFKEYNRKYGQKIWTDASPKKISEWLINIYNDSQYNSSSSKCELKVQCDTTSYPIRIHFKKEEKLTIPTAAKDGE